MKFGDFRRNFGQHNADWYPTLANLAGASPDDPPAHGVTGVPAVDGLDMWPYITGAAPASPRTELLISSDVEGGIIVGDLKLIFGKQRFSFWQSPVSPNSSFPAGARPNASTAAFDCGLGCLFNVTSDRSEYIDLAAERPDDVARLRALYHTRNATMYSPPQMLQDPAACSARAAQLEGYLGPYYAFDSTLKIDDEEPLANRAAILFATPNPGGSGAPPWAQFANLQYLHALHNRSAADGGFEVDFTNSLNDMTAARLSKYNVLVCFVEPGALIQLQQISKEDVPSDQIMSNTTQAFLPTVRDFVQRGGGVFLFPSEQNWVTQWFPTLTKLFEMVCPIETMVEHNASNTVKMNHMSAFDLAWTDGVTADHPITAGVSQVWYPTSRMFNAGHTNPLLPKSSSWTVLLRATATTQTVAFNVSDHAVAQGPAPACANATGRFSCLGRVPGVSAPALFAVRDYGKGRVAILNQWRQYTTANLGAWLFDDQVLSKGAAGRPSDMGVLLRNAFGWLAAPSVAAGLGGYVTPVGRLSSPNDSPATAQQFAETTYDYDVAKLDGVDAADRSKTAFAGLIGAYTGLSEGSGSVAEFAAAAEASKLSFLVFLEPFALPNNKTLTAAKLSQLKADCSKHSSKTLTLIPGFWIEK